MSKVEVLITFLEKENAYFNYVSNIIDFYDIKEFGVKDLEKIIGKLPIEDLLVYSFAWDETIEGYDYWLDLDVKWNDFINEKVSLIEEEYEIEEYSDWR